MDYTHQYISGRCEVMLSGKFMFSDHKKFKDVLALLDASPGVHTLVLDFASVPYIDSAGLGMLLLARDETEKRRVVMALRRPQGQVAKMFSLSDFDKIFSIEP